MTIPTVEKGSELIEVNDWLLRYKVIGKPEPIAKKLFNRVTKAIYGRDWRIRRGVKTDIGHKAAWAAKVQTETQIIMRRAGRIPYPDDYPVFFGILAIMPRTKSTKKKVWHTGTPDYSNLYYGIENALKADHKKTLPKSGRVIPARFPDGILYRDDKQIIGPASPSGKRYVNDGEEPGIIITCIDALKCPQSVRDSLGIQSKGEHLA